MFGRDKVAIVMAEFIGTFTLASAVLAMIGRTQFPFFAAVAAGGVLGLMTLLISTASEVHLNPAITFGLWTRHQIKTTTAVVYAAAQFLAGFVAITFYEYLINSPIKSIAGDKFEPRVLVAEAVGTAIFALGVAATLSQGHKGLKKAFALGGSLAVGILVASFAGNGLLNPAVALGVQSWNWAYAVGPLAGSFVGMLLYAVVFALQPVKTKAKAVVATKSTAKKKPAAKKRK